MGGAFLLGVAAGYAIAIPVGPIALLILRTGMSRGLATAAAAGAGAATADLIYAVVAMGFGAAASTLIAPVLPAARMAAAITLGVVALRGLLSTTSSVRRDARFAGTGDAYLGFLGLTLLNPPTVIYFVSLAVGLPEVSADVASRASFAIGAFAASLSWQELLAVIGAVLHGRLTPRLQRATATVSALLIMALAIRIALG